ncbi:MAG: hypothetical protein QOI74_271 [Micromonosporaceae bacterium]|nr:hypothetical protein [Micromonosporaceae bacterium]
MTVVSVLALVLGGGTLARARLAGHRSVPVAVAVGPTDATEYTGTGTDARSLSTSEPGGVTSTEAASTATVIASVTAPDAVDDAGNTVNYAAANVLDGDPNTAWRAPGDGTAVTLTLLMPTAVHLVAIGLIPGYAKTDPATGVDRFPQNRRIAAVRWRFSGEPAVLQSFTDDSVMQRIAVDITAESVTLEIAATRPGISGFDYTAISDVSLVSTRG